MRLLRWPPHRRRSPRRAREADSAADVFLRQRVRVGLPLVLVCAWLARPTPSAIAIGAAIALLGVVVRGTAASHLTKHAGLATSGPYAITRNPLYLGSALIACGLLVAAHSWVAGALCVAYFAIFYPSVIEREERRLRARYGAAFDEYAAAVPRFWPRLGAAMSTRFAWSWRLYARNGEYTAALTVVIGFLLLWLKMRRGT
jgi:protein-S-isoprenylcysteine O-methyltransferase Ste14